MACLFAHPERKDDAREYCRTLLQENPRDIQVLAWSTARKVDTNYNKIKRKLEEVIQTNGEGTDIILGLISIYMLEKNSKKAVELLEVSEHLFIEEKRKEAWIYWYIQALIQEEQFSKANEKIAEESEAEFVDELKLSVLLAISEKSGDWCDIGEYLQKKFNDTGDKYYLYQLCRTKNRSGDFGFIYEHYNELINYAQTEHVVVIAALAAFNSGEYYGAIDILQTYQNLFYEENMPDELRKMQIECRLNLGIYDVALMDAEKLYNEKKSIDNIRNLIISYVRAGDLIRLAGLSSELIERSDLPPDIFLQLAKLVKVENSQLAQVLWRKGVESISKLSDDLISFAYTLGFELGLDAELSPLSERMKTLARDGKGGVRYATLDQLKTWITVRQSQLSKINKQYLNGEIPVHVFNSQITNRPISGLYHEISQENEKETDFILKYPLLIRHGGRTIDFELLDNKKEYNIILDITALLTAYHFGYLDYLEKGFQKIYFSPIIELALISMCDKAGDKQPFRKKSLEKIQALINNGKINISFEKRSINSL